jgi:hypothetical protein
VANVLLGFQGSGGRQQGVVVEGVNNTMMENNDLSQKIIQDMGRFLKYLPWKSDPTLVILKGHLLIEELLRAFIDKKIKNQKALDKANLNFNQCLFIAMAFHSEKYLDWLWNAARKLNVLRNKLAHNLEPKGLHAKVDDFIKYIEGHNKISFPEKLVKQFGKVPVAIMLLYYNLSIFTHFKPPTPLAEAIRKQYSRRKAKQERTIII